MQSQIESTETPDPRGGHPRSYQRLLSQCPTSRLGYFEVLRRFFRQRTGNSAIEAWFIDLRNLPRRHE